MLALRFVAGCRRRWGGWRSSASGPGPLFGSRAGRGSLTAVTIGRVPAASGWLGRDWAFLVRVPAPVLGASAMWRLRPHLPALSSPRRSPYVERESTGSR
jgi:hypothetical protein